MKKTVVLLLISLVLVSSQIEGFYKVIQLPSGVTNFQNFIISLTSKSISITGGCNGASGFYNIPVSGSINFEPFALNRMFCQKNNDAAFSKQIEKSKFYSVLLNTLSLLDVNKKLICKLEKVRNAMLGNGNNLGINRIITNQISNQLNSIKLPPTVAMPISLTSLPQGQYTTNIMDDSDLRIKIVNNSISIINGCNSHSGTYKAEVNGRISFGVFASTKRFCFNDKDSVYLNSLKSSVSYSISSKRVITFRNQKGTISIILTPFKNNQNSQRLSFENGVYITNINKISNLRIQFISNFRLKLIGGCNDHTAEYKAYRNGSFSLGPFVSTKRQCIVNLDDQYLKPLSNSVNIITTTNQIRLTNQQGMTTIILTKTSTKPPTEFVTFKPGKYETNLNADADLLIQFGKDFSVQILNGCNSHSSKYRALKNGSILFDPFMSTRRACLSDQDSIYLNALRSAVTFKLNQNQITFKNASGVTTIILKFVSSNQIVLTGTYSAINIPKSPILIEFTENRVSIVNGCNNPSAEYKAYENGTIKINDFISTLMFCPNDQDSVYTSALSKSVSFSNQQSLLVLKDSFGQLTLSLFPVNPTVDPVPTKDKPTIMVDPIGFNDPNLQNLQGIYTASLGTSQVEITFTNNQVTISGGCNNQDAQYMTLNGTVKFGMFMSTRMFCQKDQDSLYTQALSKSVSFVKNSNALTFKDSNGSIRITLNAK